MCVFTKASFLLCWKCLFLDWKPMVMQKQINVTVKRKEMYFPSIYKKCQVNITNESYPYVDKSGFLQVSFFFNSKKCGSLV